MRTLFALPLAFALALSACDGGGSSGGGGGGASDKDADGFVAIPNINGMKVKVPEGATPNGIGGAAGFHTDDDSFGFMLDEATDGKDFDAAKASTEEFLFKKWIKSDKTDDGWVFTYEIPKLELEGEDMKEVGTMYGFEVRRKIGDKTYRCHGSVAKAEGLDAVVEACNSIKAG